MKKTICDICLQEILPDDQRVLLTAQQVNPDGTAGNVRTWDMHPEHFRQMVTSIQKTLVPQEPDPIRVAPEIEPELEPEPELDEGPPLPSPEPESDPPVVETPVELIAEPSSPEVSTAPDEPFPDSNGGGEAPPEEGVTRG